MEFLLAGAAVLSLLLGSALAICFELVAWQAETVKNAQLRRVDCEIYRNHMLPPILSGNQGVWLR